MVHMGQPIEEAKQEQQKRDIERGAIKKELQEMEQELAAEQFSIQRSLDYLDKVRDKIRLLESRIKPDE